MKYLFSLLLILSMFVLSACSGALIDQKYQLKDESSSRVGPYHRTEEQIKIHKGVTTEVVKPQPKFEVKRIDKNKVIIEVK